MKVTKKELEKSQIELIVELSVEEFAPYIQKGTRKVSEEVKIEGFRPGKAPYEVLKQHVGEMTIIETAARIAINKTIAKVIDENISTQAVGQPQADLTKLAPDNPLEYKIIVSVLPEVTLGEYKDLKIKKDEVKLDEKEVQKILDNIREAQAEHKEVDRAVQDKDEVTIDIEMFLDKVPIDGGQSKDTRVIIGRDYIIPGFDQELIGAAKDEEREFTLTYPQDHHMKNLAGKKVDFKVKIKKISEIILAELDSKLASKFGAKTIDEFKENVRKDLQAEKKQRIQVKLESDILAKIVEKAKFGDIPEVLIEHELEKMMREMENDIISKGGKWEDYLSSIKKSEAELKLEMSPSAIRRVKTSLAMREIGELEKITVSDEQVKKRQEELLTQYKGYHKVEAYVKDPSYIPYLRNLMVNKNVMDKLLEWNVVK